MTDYYSVTCKVSFTVANLLLLSVALVPRAVRVSVIAEVLRLNVLECRVYEYFLMSCPGVVRVSYADIKQGLL